MRSPQNPLVSVMIPVYGTEAFIAKCLRSVLAQEYSPLEIIIVNDCTPDRSIDIAQEVIARENIHNHTVEILQHEHNQGIAATRKTLLERAHGAYFLFLDSDDYWHSSDVVSRWIAVALESDALVVISDHIIDYPKKQTYSAAQEVVSGKEYVQAILSGRQPGFSWNKLIKRDHYLQYGGAYVEGLNLLDDWCMTIPLLYNTTSLVYLHYPTVHYVQLNSNSYTHKIKPEQKMAVEKVLSLTSEYLLARDTAFLTYIAWAYINIKMMLFSKARLQDYTEIRNIHPEYDRFLSQSKLPIWKKWLYIGCSSTIGAPLAYTAQRCIDLIKRIVR